MRWPGEVTCPKLCEARSDCTWKGSGVRYSHVPRHVRDTLCKGANRLCFILLPPGAALLSQTWPILQVREGSSASFPFLLSHLTSMYLNTPVLALPVARRQAPGPALRLSPSLASSLPCDFHLPGSLRTLQAEAVSGPALIPEDLASPPDSFPSNPAFLAEVLPHL